MVGGWGLVPTPTATRGRLPPRAGARGQRHLRPAAKPLSGSRAEDRADGSGDGTQTRVARLEKGCSRVAELPVPGGVEAAAGQTPVRGGQKDPCP